MKYNKVDDINTYKLDFEEVKNVPQLNEKNARFIEGVLRIDSNYRNEFTIKEPHNDYNPIEYTKLMYGFQQNTHLEDQDKKNYNKMVKMYHGSTPYWFDKIKNTETKYEENLMGAIISIDSNNSTRLETSFHGREEVKNRIIKLCPNCNKLVEKLKIPFTCDNPNHILAIIANAIKGRKDETEVRYNISFASKFCFYAYKYLISSKDIPYCKFDNIVASNLYKYDSTMNKNTYNMNRSLSLSLKQRLKIYSDFVENVFNILKSNNNIISNEDLDNIIWYYFKGRIENDDS